MLGGKGSVDLAAFTEMASQIVSDLISTFLILTLPVGIALREAVSFVWPASFVVQSVGPSEADARC